MLAGVLAGTRNSKGVESTPYEFLLAPIKSITKAVAAVYSF